MRRRSTDTAAQAVMEADAAAATPIDRFLSKPEILQLTGWSEATLWREERAGRFPASVQTSRNRVGYLQSEVAAWVKGRVAARDARAA